MATRKICMNSTVQQYSERLMYKRFYLFVTFSKTLDVRNIENGYSLELSKKLETENRCYQKEGIEICIN